jgi:hypothetical protein
MKVVITFTSSHLAMHANKLFSNSEISCEIIPTPRQISSECGFTLLGEVEDLVVLQEFIEKNKIDSDKIYVKKGELYEEC